MAIRLAVIGSGWRARYYMQIAKDHPEEVQVVGVLCRHEEKAEAIRKDFGVMATLSEEDIIASKPDVVIVAVTKASICDVSLYWQSKGYVVLCETPVALTIENIKKVHEVSKKSLMSLNSLTSGNGLLMVAEQYRYYPTYRKLIDEVRSGLIGEPVAVNLSAAHDYHGVNLIRNLLGEDPDASFRIRVEKYDLPLVKTMDRYNAYTDGEIINKPRTLATIEFADGKLAFQDFDGEQYRSTIRHNSFKITGTRGEIINEKCWYLDENNMPCEKLITENIQSVRGFPEDYEAILVLIKQAYRVSTLLNGTCKDEEREEIYDIWKDNFVNGLSDAYMATLMYENTDGWVNSERF